jgi:hypothetical protein
MEHWTKTYRKEYNKEYRIKNKEKCKKLSKEWRENNKEKKRIYLRNWRKNHSKYNREWKKNHPNYMREWWINHKGYLREWSLENNFQERYKQIIKVGKIANKFIKIPKGYKCEICSINLAIQRHHEDYSKPLEVILCCKTCHGLLDEIRHNKENLLKNEI